MRQPSFYEYKIFLFHDFFDSMKYRTIDTFLTLIEQHLQTGNNEGLYIKNQNPVKISLMLIDLLKRIEDKFKLA